MSIKYAILGLLSWTPLTGYDLKKLFAESEILYWSGNNNQIYRTLVKLHQEALVTQEIQQQEHNPSRKVYAITAKGLAELRLWVLSAPQLPQIRNPFLIQLSWADQLDFDELDALLASYEEELHVKSLMLQTQAERNPASPARTPRQALIWDKIAENTMAFYARELDWVRELRQSLRAT